MPVFHKPVVFSLECSISNYHDCMDKRHETTAGFFIIHALFVEMEGTSAGVDGNWDRTYTGHGLLQI